MDVGAVVAVRSPTTMAGALDILIFEIGSVRYALPSADVRELHRAVAIVPLPKAPPIVEGLINVHGSVVPVLDVRSRFRLPPKPLSHTDHLIVAWAGERLVALRVDRALDVARLHRGDIEPAGVGADEYVAGVAKLADGLVLIHDLRVFLDAAEAATLDDAISPTTTEGTG